MALERNKLNKFSSFNCIWFMDVATRSEIRSSAYKNKRGRIARSSGIADTAGASLQTFDEQNLGVKGEYFIDNVSTQAYVSPNPYSGVANVTRIEFEITEPYSIGLFLETLELAAREAGYRNYLDAPFTLGVEFVGYENNGSVSTVERRVLLIKITKATFNVTAAGSVYNIQAIPWNHQALLDQSTQIPVNLNIKGDTVEEILTSLAEGGVTDIVENTRPDGLGADQVVGQEVTGVRSLIKELNDHESREIEAKGGRNVTPTQYEILFPTDPTELGTKNEFASKKIADNFNYTGNVDLGIPEMHYDEENSIFTRGNLSIDEESRVYQFKQGTKIEKIIEEVILTSKWSEDILEKKPDQDGYVNWFKILTLVEILDGEKDRFGGLPKKYTFIVYPYKIHISVLTPTATTINYNPSVRNAVRGYSYTYTGDNDDIIDFNIDIDYAWIQAVANLMQRSLADTDQGGLLAVQKQTAALINQGVDPGLAAGAAREIVANQGGTSNTFSNYGGAGIDTEQTRVARAFNDAIVNSNADLIKLKMTIWGDPYFLADTDHGGYIAQRRVPNQSADGAMDHIRSEVDVLVQFAGAVDYKNNLLTPNIARQFTGVYRLIRVNSLFENGMFKQELEMIRRRNQDTSTVENVMRTFNAFNNGGSPFISPPTTGTNVQSLNLFLKQAEEIERLFNIFGQLNFQDLASALNITPFGLISQLNDFSQLFDQAKQIKSAVGNLGNLASNINLSNISPQSLQQLTSELTNAQDFFEKAFSEIDVSSLTQALQQDLSSAQGSLSQLSGSLDQLSGQIQESIQSTIITFQGVQGANIPSSIPQGITSILRPTPRPRNVNPTGTRLVETPEGPRRIVVDPGGRNQANVSGSNFDRNNPRGF